MKSRIFSAIFALLSLSALGQSGKTELTDDLIRDKQKTLAGFVPMSDGSYLYKMYVIPPAEFMNQMDQFKSVFKNQLAEEKSAQVRELKAKDLEYYRYNVLRDYTLFYGMDSLGMENFSKFLSEKKGTPGFERLLDSAHKKIYLRRLDAAEKKQLEDFIKPGEDLNNEILFKRSAAYRKWLDDYITKLRQTKYRTDTTLGYQGNYIVKLKVVNKEISNPFIKEYLNYQLSGIILKSVRNAAAKEDAYRNFMAMATNAAYKKEIQVIYDNYKRMSSNSPAPDFTYNSVEGKMVSLKDLRGKYVYIDVWATWCAPCKAEIPFLTKVEEAYHGKNIHFVSLSVDGMKDKDKWISYVREHQLQGIQVMADKDFNSEFIKKFNINSIPRFILIDPKGNIVEADAKRPSDPALRKQLDALL